MQLSGTRVLLTGASSGVGRALALQLAQGGAVLALTARRRPLLEELAEEIVIAGGPPPAVIESDLSVRGRAARLAETALAELGRIDLVINNAGSNLHGCPSAVGDRDEARDLFELNLWAPLALIHKLLPKMRAGSGGMVVNVSSLAVVAPFPAVGHYCASKAALSLATRALQLELSRSNVRVLEVLLGVLATDGAEANRAIEGAERWLDSAWPASPERAALAIRRAIERDRSRMVFPRRLSPVPELPVLGRTYAGWAVRGFDPDRVAIRRTS